MTGTMRISIPLGTKPDVSLVFPNGTWKRVQIRPQKMGYHPNDVKDHPTWELLQISEVEGATEELYDGTLPMTVFVAADGCEAYHKEGWIPEQGDLDVKLKELPGGGSCIFHEEWGHIPGLSGTLFVQTNGNRIQINTRNISVDGKTPISTIIEHGQTVVLTDINGVTLLASIRAIVGQSVLLTWWPKQQKSTTGAPDTFILRVLPDEETASEVSQDTSDG